jgi:hypothetical protein
VLQGFGTQIDRAERNRESGFKVPDLVNVILKRRSLKGVGAQLGVGAMIAVRAVKGREGLDVSGGKGKGHERLNNSRVFSVRFAYKANEQRRKNRLLNLLIRFSFPHSRTT